jgi:outer membrane biosynthesis protein TonB
VTAAGSKPVVLLTLGALVVTFAIAFGIGKLTKNSTVAATPAKTHVVSLSSEKPAVPQFEGGGSIPALKAAPKRKATKPANSGSSSSPPQEVNPTPKATPTPRATPTPKAKPKPREKPKVFGGGD